MQKIVIIGGGFAGLWSDFSAWRHVNILKKQEETHIPFKNLLQSISVSFVLGEMVDIDCQFQHVILRMVNRFIILGLDNPCVYCDFK